MITAMHARVSLATWYTVFALLSMAANLGSQRICCRLYQGSFAILLSIGIGTGIGLLVKYALDKAWIFRYEHRNAAHGMWTFARYVAMGLATTAVFWATEFGAQALFHTEFARLTGGALGLALGYLAKYRLDKRFVFT